MRIRRAAAWLSALGGLLALAAQAAPPSLGSPAPELRAEPLAGGESQGLADYRGRVVYLDFWATWCAPCRISLPLLDGLRAEYAVRGFEVLGVSLDEERGKALQVVRQLGLRYPTLAAPEPASLLPFGIGQMPSAYLLDRQGRVRYIHQGFRRSDLPTIRSEIEKLLEEKS
ncbi:TlpA family protein disulfide reductase [Stagnimonas aquatica]|uniref:TlpA family protein disulfide reductase n=1 Tax=Stagnimonas aquatica TaxID=2689987 RepID=UPI0013158C9C|nr:TlpA disulfide reductase family protein [Stagnimonas aquatica]